MSEDEQKQPGVELPNERVGEKTITPREAAAASPLAGEQALDSVAAGQESDERERKAAMMDAPGSVAAATEEGHPIAPVGKSLLLAESREESTTMKVDRENEREDANEEVLAASRQHTRRSFLVAGVATAGAYGFYHYIGTNDSDEMQPPPLRDAYRFNAWVSRNVFRNKELAPTYPLSRAESLRINGVFGLKMELELESWRLQLVGMREAAQHPRFVTDVTVWDYKYKAPPGNEDKDHETKVDPNTATAKKMAPESVQGQAEEDENHTGRMPRGMEEAGESDSTLLPNTPGLLLQIGDITKLPRHELVTQFKCIEGWSQIVHWAGVRMADFLELYPPASVDGKEPKYVYMETPDGDYYTGYDLSVMRHPQTLLVTEMMGTPLTQLHGAPLRLHMPTKYGYKQIKRIGLVAYTNDKPDDYWTKLGYDWYGGL